MVATGYKALKPSEEAETNTHHLINFLDFNTFQFNTNNIKTDFRLMPSYVVKSLPFWSQPGPCHHLRYLHNETSVKTGLALMVSSASTIGDYGSYTSWPVSSPPWLTTPSSSQSWEHSELKLPRMRELFLPDWKMLKLLFVANPVLLVQNRWVIPSASWGLRQEGREEISDTRW